MAFPTRSTPVYTKFTLSVPSFAVPYPSGLVAGDRIIIAADFRSPGTINNPSGLTTQKSIAGGASVGGSYYWERICDGTETGNMNFTSTVGTSALFMVQKITGSHATEAAQFATAGSNGDSTAINPPAVSPAWGAEDNLYITFGASSAGTMNFTAAPTNYTGLSSDSASSGGALCNLATAYRQYNASSDDPGNFTTSTNRFWSAMTLVIRPAAAPSNTGDIKVYNGSSFVAKPVKVWNGSAWVKKPLKRWNGSAWVTTGY